MKRGRALRTAWRTRDAATAAALGLVACGGRSALDGGDTAGGAPPVPGAPAPNQQGEGIPFDPHFDVAHDYAAACENECERKEPRPDSFCAVLGDVDSCTEDCLERLVNVDAACADCIVPSLVWTTQEVGCNDWECTCMPIGGPTFSRLEDCEPCADSLVYQASLRRAAPVPSDQGPPAVAALELDADRLREFVATDAGLFVLGDPLVGEEYEERLDLLGWDGTRRWTLPIGPVPYSRALFAVGASSIAVQPIYYLDEPALKIISVTGELTRLPFVPDVMAALPTGELLVVQDDTLYRLTASGDVVEATPFPASVSTNYQLLQLRAGGYAVLETGPNSSLAVWNAGQAGALEERWTLDSRDSWQSLVEVESGLVISGARRVDGRDSEASDWAPLLTRFSLDGELQWEWAPASDTVGGILDQVLETPAALFTVSTEDPEQQSLTNQRRTPQPGVEDPFAGLCPVYGCRRLVVRRFGLDGTLTWEYQHKSETSAALDATWFGGHLLVLVELTHEEKTYRVLTFSAD